MIWFAAAFVWSLGTLLLVSGLELSTLSAAVTSAKTETRHANRQAENDFRRLEVLQGVVREFCPKNMRHLEHPFVQRVMESEPGLPLVFDGGGVPEPYITFQERQHLPFFVEVISDALRQDLICSVRTHGAETRSNLDPSFTVDRRIAGQVDLFPFIRDTVSRELISQLAKRLGDG